MKPLTKATLILVLLAGCAACGRRAGAIGLLPPPPPGPVKPSAYQPERPLVANADGVLARPVQRATEAPFTTETRDLLVPPGKKLSMAEAGAVLVIVQEGTGQARQNGKESPLKPGSALAFPEGERAEIDNNGTAPLALRIYIIRGQ